MQDRFDVVVIGAGAAGIAALRELRARGCDAIALEARERIGGRARTWRPRPDLPLDCGCGWLHSADVNPLVPLIAAAGFEIDKTPPPWGRQAFDLEFPAAAQDAFARAWAELDERVEAAARTGVDRPVAELLEADGRWNALLDAISTYYNGVELSDLSALDYAAYEDTEVNWRAPEGYGAAVAALADPARIVTGCPALSVDHQGPDVRIATPHGVVSARAVIVAVPTPHIAQGRLRFAPDVPAKRAAADGLPLGLADKVFLAVADPEALPADGHLSGRTDRTETGSYHLRPFGRPYIEVYLGGRLARTLEGEGDGAMAAFAMQELGELLGADFRRGLSPLGETRWAQDPFALGAYSHARPGRAGDRAVLAEPVDGRLFFAGEATSSTAYSTAHGAWESGRRAAAEALAAL